MTYPTVDPETGYGQHEDGIHDLPAPDPIVALIEQVMRGHLPLRIPGSDGSVLCLEHPPGQALIYRGPVYHRWHVAEHIRDALKEAGWIA